MGRGGGEGVGGVGVLGRILLEGGEEWRGRGIEYGRWEHMDGETESEG